jgi:hypothetical protein
MYDILFADGNIKCIPSGFTEHILRHEIETIQPTNIVEPTCNISSDDDSEDEDGVRDGEDSWPDTQDDLAEQAAEWEAWAHSLAGAGAVPGLESIACGNDGVSTSAMANVPAGVAQQFSAGVIQKMPSRRQEGIGSLPGEVETAGVVDRAGSALFDPQPSMPTGESRAPNVQTTQVSAHTIQHVSVAKLPTFGAYNQSGIMNFPDSVGIAGMAAVDAGHLPSSEPIAEYSSANALTPQIPAQTRQQVRFATKTKFFANTQFMSRNSPAPPEIGELAAEATGDHKHSVPTQQSSVPTSQSYIETAEASTETPEVAINPRASPSNPRVHSQQSSKLAQQSSAPSQHRSAVEEQSSEQFMSRNSQSSTKFAQQSSKLVQQSSAPTQQCSAVEEQSLVPAI